MHKSKLIKHLRVLNKAELKRLEKFINSPFFVEGETSKAIQLLYYFLKPFHPQFDNSILKKEQVFKKLFPDQEFIKGKVEKMMSNLLKAVRKFIAYQTSGLDKSNYQQDVQLCKFYQERQMDDLFQITSKRLEKRISKSRMQHKDYFLDRLLLGQSILEYESKRNDRKGDLNLPANMQNLDHFYLNTKLQYACWMLSQHNYQMPIDINSSLDMLYQVLPLVDQGHFKNVPTIQVYYHAFLLMQNQDDEQYFYQFQNSLAVHQQHLPEEQLKAMLTFIRTFCIRQANRGKKQYLEKAYKLYREHLEAGYMHYDGGVLLSAVRNIVTMGLALKKYEWVRQFLDKYKNRIVDSRHPENVYNFNMAHYHFVLQSYEKALTFLAPTYEDAYYKLAAKRLELKIYYEQDSVLLDSKIEAFKIYLHRNSKKTMPELQRQGNHNFVNMLIQIIHPKTLGNPLRLNKLIEKVRNSKGIAEKKWVIEKLEILLKKLW